MKAATRAVWEEVAAVEVKAAAEEVASVTATKGTAEAQAAGKEPAGQEGGAPRGRRKLGSVPCWVQQRDAERTQEEAQEDRDVSPTSARKDEGESPIPRRQGDHRHNKGLEMCGSDGRNLQ